jgi:hypothetical protein
MGVAGALHGRPAGRVLRSAVALGVAALPEGLPLVATAALVRSMQRLHQRAHHSLEQGVGEPREEALVLLQPLDQPSPASSYCPVRASRCPGAGRRAPYWNGAESGHRRARKIVTRVLGVRGGLRKIARLSEL